jgi:hypothetical protein
MSFYLDFAEQNGADAKHIRGGSWSGDETDMAASIESIRRGMREENGMDDDAESKDNQNNSMCCIDAAKVGHRVDI